MEGQLRDEMEMTPPETGRAVPADAGPLVECVDLVRHFGEVKAVDGVSFEVEAGEIFGLLGPNGAGKTTCLRILATLLHPTDGFARVCGHDTIKEPTQVKRAVGYQTGDTRLYERLNPVEFLRYFGELQDMDRGALEERIERLVEMLDIGDYADRLCGSLSTGQQQRVGIARALLHDPPVLILDEPTTGLDILSSQFMVDFLAAERERGKAIIVSTHIMSEAELLCDRIGVLHQGHLLCADTQPALLERTGEQTLARAFLHLIEEHDSDMESHTPEGP